MKNNKYLYAIIAVVYALFFIWMYSYTYDPKLDLNGDNAIYINLAHNIADGYGYCGIDLNGNAVPASHFPPGYSAILSIAILLGVKSLLGFKIINAIFLFLSMSIIWMLVKKASNSVILASAVAVVTLLCPTLMHFAGIVMSEMSYMFFTFLALFSLFMYKRKRDDDTELNREKSLWYDFLKSPWFYIAVISAVVSYHIRTVGASAMFAVFVFFLFRKEWIASLGTILLSVLLMLPWMIRNKIHGIKGRYLDTIMVVNPWRPEEGTISSFGEMFEKMLGNFDETVIKGFKEILFPFITIDPSKASSFLGIIGGIIILAVIFYGAWNMKKLRWSLFGFILANIGLFALWHGGNGCRYVTPIAPILFACFYMGIFSLCTLCLRKINKVTFISSVLTSCIIGIMVLLMIPSIKEQHVVAKRPYPLQYQQYFNMAEQMQSHLPPRTVVCCRKPELFKYYAPDMCPIRYEYTEDTNALLSKLAESKVEYVIIDNLGYASTPRYLVPAVNSRLDLFGIVMSYKNTNQYLLKFDYRKYENK